jgi:chorismate mutase
MYVYIDESGDLGFSLRSSRYFVVAYLILDNPFEVAKIMKRLLKKLHERKEYARGCNELKYSNSKDAVRRKVLEKICKGNVEIGFVVLEKAKVKPELKEKTTVLYNFVIVDAVMKNILPRLTSTDKLYIVVDKTLSRLSKDAFNKYAINKASWLMTVQWRQTEQIRLSNIEVRHENSQREPCLQAVDFLAGACFHKYEHNNDCYYRIIESKVEYFDYLWK